MFRPRLVPTAVALLVAVSAHAADMSTGAAMETSRPAMMSKSVMADPTTSKALRENERALNDAFKNRDTTTFFRYVERSAVAADPSGFSTGADAPNMLRDVTVGSFSTDEMKVTALNPDTYLLTYTWKGEMSVKGQAVPPSPIFCSTVWTRRGRSWKAVFHQETPAMPEPPAGVAH